MAGGAPHLIDAGSTEEQAYSVEQGFGYDSPSEPIANCGDDVGHTYRRAVNSDVLSYRFDHLLPTRFYHLDLTFFLCSGTRGLRVTDDDGHLLVSDVTAGQTLQTITVLLTPAAYADGNITINIEKLPSAVGAPVVSALRLSDIRYCYRDAGGSNEASFGQTGDDCGYLDGSSHHAWGTLPHQTIRFDDDGELRYRFARLNVNDGYRLLLTFFAADGMERNQTVLIDGQVVQDNIQPNLNPQTIELRVPAAAAADGIVEVAIIGEQPVVSEIALEQWSTFESTGSRSQSRQVGN